MLYNLLGSTQSVVRILDFNVNKLPNDYHDQYQTLGSSDYSEEKHMNTMKRSKSIFLSMLTEQDCYYILASALGRLDETDYAFNHMPTVKARNKLNKTEMRSKNYRLKTVNLFKSLPYAKMMRAFIEKYMDKLEI